MTVIKVNIVIIFKMFWDLMTFENNTFGPNLIKLLGAYLGA